MTWAGSLCRRPGTWRRRWWPAILPFCVAGSPLFDTQYKGIYQAVNQMFLEHSGSKFKMVNREQDLDDEGLRKAKLSYNPLDFLKKYRIVLQ